MKSTKTCTRLYWHFIVCITTGLYHSPWPIRCLHLSELSELALFSWGFQQWITAWFQIEAQSGLRLQYSWLGLQMLYRHVPTHLAFCYLNNASFWSPTNDIWIFHKTKESDVLIIWQLSTLRDLCAVAYIYCTCVYVWIKGFIPVTYVSLYMWLLYGYWDIFTHINRHYYCACMNDLIL